MIIISMSIVILKVFIAQHVLNELEKASFKTEWNFQGLRHFEIDWQNSLWIFKRFNECYYLSLETGVDVLTQREKVMQISTWKL